MTLRGLIPARAGTTAWMRGTHRVRRAHPRSRGDHGLSRPGCCCPAGSSPLARGPQGPTHEPHCIIWLIPARAGTTAHPQHRRNPNGAHPRSRGDHMLHLGKQRIQRGSSPLARGPPVAILAQRVVTGLIPARAGTTRYRQHQEVHIWAHPRSRGDHLLPEGASKNASGSSPLARGPHRHNTIPGVRCGLIPARAGTTLADMGFYPLHQQNRITLKPEPKSRIHDKQLLLTTTSTAILTRLTPP